VAYYNDRGQALDRAPSMPSPADSAQGRRGVARLTPRRGESGQTPPFDDWEG